MDRATAMLAVVMEIYEGGKDLIPGWELKAWIKGFLPHVRVIKPASLRDEIVRDIERARGRLAGQRAKKKR